MKTVYAVRNGKVVDVTNEPKQVKERAFHINIKGSFLSLEIFIDLDTTSPITEPILPPIK